MTKIIAMLVFVMCVSTTIFAADICSPIKNCVGMRFELNAQGNYVKVEDGTSFPLSGIGTQRLCRGAMFASPAVDFSTGIRFIVNVMEATGAEGSVLGKNALVAQGIFVDLSSHQYLAQMDTSVESNFLGGIYRIGSQSYAVACTNE